VLACSAANGIVVGLALWRWGWSSAATAASALFGVLVVVCGVDLAHRRIPDRVTTPLTVATLAVTVGAAWSTGRSATLVGGIGGAFTFWALLGVVHLVAPAGLGRGDVKLAPSLGAAVGLEAGDLPGAVGAVVGTLAVAAAVGVAIGLVLLVVRRRNEPYPFGPALAVATVFVLVAPPL
jgi:leader peptidase (prepilin peptidase)/N-methyltransferase